MKTRISRRTFLATAAAAAVTPRLGWTETTHTPAQPLQEFEYGAVRLAGGPLGEQYNRIHATFLALGNDRLLKVYRQHAGLPAPGADMGGWYDADDFVPGHTLGQYISGLSRLAKTTGDEPTRQKAVDLVNGFAATMGAKNLIFAGPKAETLWPCYIVDKHLQGLLDAYHFAGVQQARELLPRVLQGALPFIPEKGRDRVGKKDPPYDETYIMPETLFAAHELTGEKLFRERALEYLLDREFFDPLARGEDVLPGRHAYSHAIAMSSAGKAYAVLGDEKYLRALQTAYRLLETEQQFATGGWGPNETFITPHKGELYESLHTTEDHFETPCGSYAAIKLARYLLCATGDARYADGLERVVFNALMAVKNPDGDGNYPYYSTYSNNARKVYYQKKWPCCSGTLVEGVADYVKDIYFRSHDGVAVAFYAPSEVRWTQGGAEITLQQETDYPVGEAIHLHVHTTAAASFTMRLRIPAWSAGRFTLTVNGKPAQTEVQKGFAVVKRTWANGDRVRLELPLHFRTEAIDDVHTNVAAVLRGPLVYVELNPPEGALQMAELEKLRQVGDAHGTFASTSASRTRVHVPFYFVRDERYTTYFEKA